FFITPGPDGSLWFTEFSFNPKVARITVAGTVSEFPTSHNVAPFGIAVGPDGNLWFTEAFDPDYHNFAPAIGRLTPTGVLTRFPLPESSNPFDITAGPDGNLWFTESVDSAPSRNRIGRITTAGVLTEFPIPGGPRQITAGPDGNLWFTVPSRSTIGRITTGGAITEFPIPTASSGPEGITTGPDGNLWFTEFNGNKIGRITTTGSVTEFPIPTAQSGPFEITVGPDGNLWFTERAANQIGRITPAGLITEFPIPTSGSLPSGITTGPDGNIWFTELNGNQIGRLALAGVPALDTRILPVVGSTPGANGTFFKTSVQLHNSTSSAISGRIVFHPSGVAGSDSDPSLSYSLAPGQTQSIADLLPAMGRSGLGSADIVVVSGSAPTASVRVFNDAGPAGTTGFTEEPMRPGDALFAGRQAVLVVPADLTAFRFNIGVRTLEEGASITLTSRDADGAILDRVLRSFPAVYHEQEGAGAFLRGGHHEIPPGGTVTVVVNSGSAIVYGATVDNRTGDPSLQIARATQ
ncbi:MAG: virginiamycin B lyase family protein, partial [Thermoplasmata archaeon]